MDAVKMFVLNPPLPPIDPALKAPTQGTPGGQWILPGIIILISIILDWSAIGNAAKRDRVAALLTYSATLAYISIFNLAPKIQGIPKSWSALLAGSAIAFIVHLGFVIVLIGPYIEKLKPLATKLSHMSGVGVEYRSTSTDVEPYTGNTGASTRGTRTARGARAGQTSGVGRLNTKLHMWAIFAGCTYVLARGPLAVFTQYVGTTIATVSGTITRTIMHGLGG